MALTITQDQGLLVSSPGREYRIDEHVIFGINDVTGGGRDMEDGLAPLEYLSAIVARAMDVSPDEFPMPEIPEDNWLRTLVENDQLDLYAVDPIMAALGLLTMFGGEASSVTIGVA